MISLAELVADKLTNCASCAGCQYLYMVDDGYSNFTIEETKVFCALDLNPNIDPYGADLPHDWAMMKSHARTDLSSRDNWPVTQDSRCVHYHGPSPKFMRIPTERDDPRIAIGIDQTAYDEIERHYMRRTGELPVLPDRLPR